jgi:hypothetical protein
VRQLCFRKAIIEKGDRYVDEARRIARASPHGFLPRGCVKDYVETLNEAATAYAAGGLGLLAGRVAFFARRVAVFGDCENVRDSLRKFDRLNVGGGGVA